MTATSVSAWLTCGVIVVVDSNAHVGVSEITPSSFSVIKRTRTILNVKHHIEERTDTGEACSAALLAREGKLTTAC